MFSTYNVLAGNILKGTTRTLPYMYALNDRDHNFINQKAHGRPCCGNTRLCNVTNCLCRKAPSHTYGSFTTLTLLCKMFTSVTELSVCTRKRSWHNYPNSTSVRDVFYPLDAEDSSSLPAVPTVQRFRTVPHLATLSASD